MIINSISKIRSEPFFYQLMNFIPNTAVNVKLEGLNMAGSIKLTTAIGLVNDLEKSGKINSDTILIESSSGNLGVALSLVCKERGYRFKCVTDPNILPDNEKLIGVFGGELIKITERDENGGYLASRIRFIQNLISQNPSHIWINQYANPANYEIHSQVTAKEIHNSFRNLDFLFIGAGTTGTLMGCAKFFKKNSPNTKIIGIDSVGSVTFDAPARKRHVPGIGTSRKPEIVDKSILDDIVMVNEIDGIRVCNDLLKKHGLFFGGSTGSVLHGIYSYAPDIPEGSSVVCISPDFGHRYIDTVYNSTWVEQKFN